LLVFNYLCLIFNLKKLKDIINEREMEKEENEKIKEKKKKDESKE
jgi:hypothetical protein